MSSINLKGEIREDWNCRKSHNDIAYLYEYVYIHIYVGVYIIYRDKNVSPLETALWKGKYKRKCKCVMMRGKAEWAKKGKCEK